MDLKKFGGLLGIMAGASLPDDAEGAVRPDILDVVKNAVAGKRYAGKRRELWRVRMQLSCWKILQSMAEI